jgi:hypothetical protein
MGRNAEQVGMRANPRLAALIAESGSSHAGLARRVNELAARQGVDLHYDKSSVTRWLDGKQPRGEVPQLIADALSAKLGRPVAVADCGFAVPQALAVSARSLIYPVDVGESLHALSELGTVDVSRRSVLGAVPFIAAALVAPQRHWLLDLAEDEGDHPDPIDADSPAAAVLAMIGVFDSMDNRFGGAHARVSVIHYLTGEVIPLLHRRDLPAAERTELFTGAAKLAATAGWMSYDTGEYGLAQRYMTQALRLCKEGRDKVLAGQILAGMSHLAISLGHSDEGAALARAGIVTARDSGSPLGVMRLHAMAARAHAAAGDEKAATASLAAADKALAASRGPVNESAWVGYLDPAYLQAESAHCFRDLGRGRSAEAAARTSVAANGQRGRRQAISQAVLATAYLQQNQLDAAVATATEGLGMLGKIHSQRSTQALRDFRKRLAPHGREPIVTRFHQASQLVLGAA